MEIITGKKWKEKTEHYMKESLHQSSIWLVDQAMKEDYERLLLELSDNKAILLQRVMTFDEFYQELLLSHHIFKRNMITPVQSLLVIYELLNDFNGEIIRSQDDATLKQLHQVFSIFKRYKSDLDKLDEVELPAFSKKKLEECKVLYGRYLEVLNKYDWVMKEDYEIGDITIDDTIHFYIDQIEDLDEQKLSLIRKMKHCKVLLTCDENVDGYTQFIKSQFENIEASFISFDEQVSSFKEYLASSYQNLKAPQYEGEYPLTGIKAIQQPIEIQYIAVEIYKAIASKKATYQDFRVYCTSQDYLEKIYTIFNEHDLPCFVEGSLPVYQTPIMMFLKGLWMYAKTKDEQHLITLFRSRLYNGIYSISSIDIFEKQLKTRGECVLEDYQGAKYQIDTLLNQMEIEPTSLKKINVLVNFLESLEVTKSVSDETGYAYISQTFDYLKQFEVDVKINQEDFLDLLLKNYSLHIPKEEKTMDMIVISTNNHIYTNAKYVYILGCNEDSFPIIEKDNSIILNDEYIACKQKGIHLGLNLFERIEKEYLQWFKLFYLEKEFTLSYVTGSLGGDDFLPSSLYLSLMKQFKGKDYEKEEIVVNRERRLNDVTTPNASLDIALNYGQKNDVINPISSLVETYRHNKNQPSLIDVSLLERLIAKHGQKALSPSELEVYNGCPFKYYVRYALGIYPWQNTTLKANDFGTIVHDVLDVLSDLYEGKKSIQDYLNEYEIMDIKTSYEQEIYPSICESDILNDEDKGLFLIIHHIASKKIDKETLTASQLYLFNKLQHDLFNTVKILIFQMSISDFSITDHESWVEKDTGEIILHGRIDRVERYKQYVKVVDYKSSQKALDLCLATLGFNIQMLLYLDMICQNKALEKGGVLYFNTKQRVVKSDEYLYNDQIDFEKIIKEYKMEGYINSEETLIKAIDKQYDPSVITNVKFTKSKKAYTGNILDKESFDHLLEKVNAHVDTLLDRIYHQGDIRIYPSHNDSPKINMFVDPCTYCDYEHVCLKDVFYNENHEIEYVGTKKMLEILGGEKHD